MASPFTADQPFKENNVINESERSVDPTDDVGKLVQLEADGLISSEFLRIYGAFPVVEATASSVNNTANSTVSVDMPAGIVAGDLLLAFTMQNLAGDATASGWNLLSASGSQRFHIFTKVAVGSDAMSLNKTQSTNSAHVVIRVSGWNHTPNFTQLKLEQASSATIPLNEPFSEIKNTLWIAVQAHTNTATFSSAPTNYTGLVSAVSTGGSGGAGVGVAHRNLRQLFEEIDTTFTTSGTASNINTALLAVRPSGV